MRGPVLIVANHGSHLDAPLVLSALPPRIRRTVAVAAAKDYFFASGQRALLAQVFLGAFPLARTGPILPSLEQCGRLVDRGRSILIFPEGTRSIDGSVGPFKGRDWFARPRAEDPSYSDWNSRRARTIAKGTHHPHSWVSPLEHRAAGPERHRCDRSDIC